MPTSTKILIYIKVDGKHKAMCLHTKTQIYTVYLIKMSFGILTQVLVLAHKQCYGRWLSEVGPPQGKKYHG